MSWRQNNGGKIDVLVCIDVEWVDTSQDFLKVPVVYTIPKLMICRRILHNHSIIPPTAYFSSPPKSATRSSILKHAIFVPFTELNDSLTPFLFLCVICGIIFFANFVVQYVCSNYLFTFV